MNTTDNLDENLEYCYQSIQKAVDDGSNFILFPEVFYYRSVSLSKKVEPLDGPIVQALRQKAKENKVAILAGSIYEPIEGSKKVYNTSILIDEYGEITGIYRKIHLFNVNLNGTRIIESLVFEAGEKPVIGTCFGLKIGMSICYDLRFPELFRHYSKEGVELMVCPASFTFPTGEAHWEALCRARAIENQCFFLAPNQTGIGAGKIASFGTSLIVDPWGTVLSKASTDKSETITSDLDLETLRRRRKETPFLKHRTIGL